MTERRLSSHWRAASCTCFGGDRADAVRPAAHVVDGGAGRQRGAVPARHADLVVLRIDRVGDQARSWRARAPRPMTPLAISSAITRVGVGFELRQRDALARRDVDAEFRHVERGAVVPGAGAHRDALVHHQRAVEPAVGAGAQDMREHFQRFRLAGLGGAERRHQIVALQHRLLDARIGERQRAHRHRRRLLRALARQDIGVARDLAVGVFART